MSDPIANELKRDISEMLRILREINETLSRMPTPPPATVTYTVTTIATGTNDE